MSSEGWKIIKEYPRFREAGGKREFSKSVAIMTNNTNDIYFRVKAREEGKDVQIIFKLSDEEALMLAEILRRLVRVNG